MFLKILPDRLIGRQFKKPKGFIGKLLALRMNKRNKPLYEVTFQQMNIQPDDTILEVGFGNGLSLKWLADQVPSGRIYGIDISKTMVKEAGKKCHDLIRMDKIKIFHVHSGHIPFKDVFFNKVLTINTIYFWDDAEQVVREMYRVLKPEGRVFISFRPKDHLQKHKYTCYDFIYYEPEDIEKILAKGHFKDIGYIARKGTTGDVICAYATKRS